MIPRNDTVGATNDTKMSKARRTAIAQLDIVAIAVETDAHAVGYVQRVLCRKELATVDEHTLAA